MDSVYSKKYIKYKSKYLDLKQHGGAIVSHSQENEDKENETNQTSVNKRLLEASLVEDGSDLNASKYLAPINQNLRRVLDMSGVKTPIKSTSGIANPSSATSSNLNTPSTERKKSAQCAQQ